MLLLVTTWTFVNQVMLRFLARIYSDCPPPHPHGETKFNRGFLACVIDVFSSEDVALAVQAIFTDCNVGGFVSGKSRVLPLVLIYC